MKNINTLWLITLLPIIFLRKTALLALLHLLWPISSSREFHLQYSIQKIKKQQDLIATAFDRYSLCSLNVNIINPLLELEGSQELYNNYLHHIIMYKKLSYSVVNYFILSDQEEQHLLLMSLKVSPIQDIKLYAITFYYKFIAVYHDTTFRTPPIQSTSFFRNYIKKISTIFIGFTFTFWQPPD